MACYTGFKNDDAEPHWLCGNDLKKKSEWGKTKSDNKYQVNPILILKQIYAHAYKYLREKSRRIFIKMLTMVL